MIVDRARGTSAPSFGIAKGVRADHVRPQDQRFAASGVDVSGAARAATLPAGAIASGISYTALLRVGSTGTLHSTTAGTGQRGQCRRRPGGGDQRQCAGRLHRLFRRRDALRGQSRRHRLQPRQPGGGGQDGGGGVATLSAATLFAGEVWTVILDDSTFTSTHTHVVSAGETLADIARELAKSIVAGAVNSFTATASGNRLVITNLDGTAFVANVEVTPVGQVSIIETRKFNQAQAGNCYFYRPVNLNTRVDETTQVDTLNVFNGGSPADDIGVLTADHLTGLGMAGDTVIAGRTLAGGIVYGDIEVLNIELGSGNDTFTVASTHAGATNISTGAGNDTVYVQSIDGHHHRRQGRRRPVQVGSQAAGKPGAAGKPPADRARTADPDRRQRQRHPHHRRRLDHRGRVQHPHRHHALRPGMPSVSRCRPSACSPPAAPTSCASPTAASIRPLPPR